MKTIALKLNKETLPGISGCKYIFEASDTNLIMNNKAYKVTYLADLAGKGLHILLVDDYNVLPDFCNGEQYLDLTDGCCTVTTQSIERCGLTGLIISSIDIGTV